MKMLVRVLAILAVLHVLGAAALAAYLGATDRLNVERVKRAADMFVLTMDQERQAAEEAKAAEAEALEIAKRQARITGGAVTAAEQITAEQRRHEMLLRQLERTRREIKALSDNLHLARQRMERDRAELVEAKDAMEQRLADLEARLNDEGFKKTVQLYETLPADQVKSMFVQLMQQQKTDQVVAYLEAMQPRKAAGVLKEFEGNEVDRAVELTERLRARGSDLVKQVEQTG